MGNKESKVNNIERQKEFGSGYFGEWIKGINGAPAYLYTCRQDTDPKAVTYCDPAWRKRTEHSFVFGNDRVTVLASNYCHVQVRQDEGTPKFLNDYKPKRGEYGAGWGTLRYTLDGAARELNTLYSADKEITREYGSFYFKKTFSDGAAKITETLFCPYGDDPVMLDTVSVTNLTDKPVTYDWEGYYSVRPYQFTFADFVLSQLTFNTANVSRRRRRFSRSFAVSIGQDGTVRQEFKFIKHPIHNAVNAIGDRLLRRINSRFYGAERAYLRDYCPPAAGFIEIGKGAIISPLKEKNILGKSVKAMFTERSFTLKPGETIEFTFAYYYLPEGFTAEGLSAKYSIIDAGAELHRTAELWNNDRIKAEFPDTPWIDRELNWHNAYLRGSMSYNSFFKAHILSQGGHYQYLMGLQGAPRDQLQHALPFIYSAPAYAREHIIFTLKELSEDGELPYATMGEGVFFSFVMRPSDLQIMLLSFAGEYVLTTRDKAFLDTEYTLTGKIGTVTMTVREGLSLAYKYLREKIGTGIHGLVKMKTGDWNDQAVYGRVPVKGIKTAQKEGESMLNSAIAVYACKAYGEALKLSGYLAEGEDSIAFSESIAAAMRWQWNGKWYRRAYMGGNTGWLGDDILWLEPQPWALISGVPDKEQAATLTENIDKYLIKPNPNGAQLIQHDGKTFENSKGLDVGVLENGGIWYAVNGYLAWALAESNPALAWEEFKRNTRAYQAEAYPDIWYGIWSGPDSVNSTAAKYPGRTQSSFNPVTGKREKLFKLTVGVDWEDFPVLNLHAHTWQQYIIFRLLRLKFDAEGYSIDPVIPEEKYSISSLIFSCVRDKDTYTVKYCPLDAAPCSARFSTSGRKCQITHSGAPVPFMEQDGFAIFTSEAEKEYKIEIE